MSRNFDRQCAAVIAAGLLLVTAQTATAATIFVSTLGANSNDGASWATAKRTIRAAVNASLAGDQIWVATGHYVERITLRDGVALYGGFVGDENPASFNVDDRDLLANITIIDGNHGGTVVAASGQSSLTRIDGFTITNGNAEDGGGLFVTHSSLTVENNIITGNVAADDGGGMLLLVSSATITNNTIIDNIAQDGGGVAVYHSHPARILGNKISGNNAWRNRGGGLYVHSCSPLIVNNLISHNRAATEGGGAYLGGSTGSVINNTIVANGAPEGGGLLLESATLTIANNIVAYNSNGIRQLSFRPLTFSNNCFFSESGYLFANVPDPSGVAGNFVGNAVFLEAPTAGLDGAWGTADDAPGILGLSRSSPCLDAGDAAAETLPELQFDLVGNSRVVDGNADSIARIDIGAFEYQPTIPGDLDGDCATGLSDLAILLIHFGLAENARYEDGDLDRDGDVDLADLAGVLSVFGTACS